MTDAEKIEMLREALLAVEWARPRFRCGECRGQPSSGHTDNCRVRRALQATEPARAARD